MGDAVTEDNPASPARLARTLNTASYRQMQNNDAHYLAREAGTVVAQVRAEHVIGRSDTLCAVIDELRRERDAADARAARLRAAIEMDAAERAYAAGLGASEWRAFLSDRLCAALEEPTP